MFQNVLSFAYDSHFTIFIQFALRLNEGFCPFTNDHFGETMVTLSRFTYNANSLRARVESKVERVNSRLAQLDRGIDINKATRKPDVIDIRTGRVIRRSRGKFERKGTVTFIGDKGQRVRVQQKKIVSYRGSFASKKLSIVDQYNENTNRITLRGNESYQELINLDKATSRFLKSKTSTLSGIKEVEKNIKDNISNKMDEFDLSKDEVETLYNFFEDEDFAYIRKYVDPSDLWVFIESAKEGNVYIDDWLQTMEDYIGSDKFGRDEDLRDRLISLYNKVMGFDALL